MTVRKLYTDQEFRSAYEHALQRAREIFEERSHEYDNGVPFSEKSSDWHTDLLPYIRHKASRIQSIGAHPAKLNGEALRDSALDLANYSAFLVAVLSLTEQQDAAERSIMTGTQKGTGA